MNTFQVTVTYASGTEVIDVEKVGTTLEAIVKVAKLIKVKQKNTCNYKQVLGIEVTKRL